MKLTWTLTPQKTQMVCQIPIRSRLVANWNGAFKLDKTKRTALSVFWTQSVLHYIYFILFLPTFKLSFFTARWRHLSLLVCPPGGATHLCLVWLFGICKGREYVSKYKYIFTCWGCPGIDPISFGMWVKCADHYTNETLSKSPLTQPYTIVRPLLGAG
jgi:hypothetical protein